AARPAAEATSLPLYHYLGGPMATLLPVPLVTLFDGSEGLGGPRADLRTLYLVPYGFDHFRDALRACCEIHHVLGDLMQQRGQIALVTAGGGYRAPTPSAVALFDLAQQAIDGAGYDPSEQIGLGIDVGADDLVTGNNGHGVRYTLPSDADGPGGGGEDLGAEALTDRYRAWHGSAPLVSIEDGLAHTDVEGWRHLSDELSDELQLVGGDLFVSSAPNLADGIADAVANAFLVRPVQVGTLSEMLKAIEMAKINAYATLFAHASGETDDSALADLSVATQAGQARLGGVGRGEAIVKYNRLLRIEQELAQAAVYPGPSAFPRRDA
ncbi:MAG: phosphopyruvate hydratase, partial [Acidobacteriota bacterium]